VSRVRLGALALASAFAVAACAPRMVRHELTLGSERISVVLPEAWQVVDRGETVIVKDGDTELRIERLGPAGPLGIRREVERARALWNEGRTKDARWRLRTIPVPDALFASTSQRDAFWAAWSEVSDESADPRSVDAGFEHILANAAALKSADPETIADALLESEDRDQRREVATRRRRTVDGREAVVLDTWQRSTHTSRERLAFVFDDGAVIAVRTQPSAFAVTAFASRAVAFEQVLLSLRFERGAAADSAAPTPGTKVSQPRTTQ